MKVLLTRRLPSSVAEVLSAAHDVDLHEGPGSLSPEELKERLGGQDALICFLPDRITDDVLASGDRLKIVANVAVGYENIDVPAARRRGVVVTNTPDVLTDAVAEFTWGLILTAARRISEGDRFVRAGGWKGWAFDFMLGTELRGKQLGVIGGGRIGRAVAAKAPAFGMNAAFVARPGRPLPPQGARAMSLDELLVTSDVVTLHVPATEGTRHLIGRKELARMKRSALLVNVARGSVVDEEALAWALGERLIAGAALDVYEREPEVFEPLRRLDNVVLAPHLGSATRETRTAMADLAVRNVLAVLAGEAPLTPV